MKYTLKKYDIHGIKLLHNFDLDLCHFQMLYRCFMKTKNSVKTTSCFIKVTTRVSTCIKKKNNTLNHIGQIDVPFSI